MFSSHNYLKRKTPAGGINRSEFIEHLINEYYTTTNIEAQEQVTANLANFAYDPLNWDYLNDLGSVELFIELLAINNENLQLHGIAGLCNICLDEKAAYVILKESNLNAIKKLFIKTEKSDIILNILTFFYQLLSNGSCNVTCLTMDSDVIKKIEHIQSNKHDLRVNNICLLIMEDFLKKRET